MADVIQMDSPSAMALSEPHMGSALYSPRADAEVEMLPNPDFSFPARPSTNDASGSSSQRPMSAHLLGPARPRTTGISSRRSNSTLPNFSFNPSAPSSNQDPSTPPISPTLSVPTTPSRNIGHRRGGSEFIGGDGTSGTTGPLSTSPTKGDGILPPPSSSGRLGPPGGRRGHAHRRSGAISCHDLQSILQPTDANAQPRGGSAPVTPLETENQSFFDPKARRSMSQSSLVSSRVSRTDFESPAPSSENSPQRPVSRTRVGFSERVEYIRPLSTISSETESSMSTIRGHSVNGSLSSVISANAASPSTTRTSRPSLQTTFEDEFPDSVRPSTASGILEAVSAARESFGGSLTMPQRPKSAAATESPTATSSTNTSPIKSKPSKRRHLGWFDSRRSSRPLSGISLESRSEPSLVVTPPDTPAFFNSAQEADESADERVRNIKIDGDRRPRKVRSWAHSLIPGRSKPRTPTEEITPRLAPHSPPGGSLLSPEESYFNLVPDFDSDNTVDIVSLGSQAQPSPLETSFSTTPRSENPPIPDVLSPIIDLDAALGPFNTPLGARSPNGRPSSSRRQMHSGNFGNNANAFGQQHRRTESAPELAPFESRISPMNGPSLMADVFEEDEEDEESPKSKSKMAMGKRKATARTANVLPGDLAGASNSIKWSKPSPFSFAPASGLGISTEQLQVDVAAKRKRAQVGPIAQQASLDTSPELRLSRDPSPVEVVEDYEEPRTSPVNRDSDSTITPTISEDGSKQPTMLNINLPMAPPSIMTPDTLAPSPLSTPDYSRGRSSFDTPRLGTAASSITDRGTVNSYTLGEPGPEFRPSVDDVPSLTSSRSTMTSPPQHPLAQGYNAQDSRSVSVSSIPSAGAERTRKRASIASLSRLMSGSFGERSKLNIESRPQSEHRSVSVSQGEDKTKKKKKRISRLMTFWKSKESLAD